MFLMRFTERAYTAYTEEAVRNSPNEAVRLTFSNSNFDPKVGARQYNEYLDEYEYCEEAGFDGLMLNEHHNTPTCLGATMNLEAAILARNTKKPKIVLMGNPLPTFENPLRVAEEIAEIDMISNGRVVSGFVRGTGVESLAANINPLHNRERFEEAHDLLIKIWSEPGPFRWEGNHYQFRVVNPWALPLQKPHPRIWIPGVSSIETVTWAAEHRYPYICLNTTIQQTQDIWEVYDQAAQRVGYKSGPEQRGYLIRCHVADTEEKAMKNGREFMWMLGEFTGLGHPVWFSPPGYSSPESRRRRAETQVTQRADPFDKQLENKNIIAGTPDQVIASLKQILEETRPSILALWGNDGKVDHKDSMDCIRLMGQEVMPALREIGKDLGLDSPFDVDSPISLAETPASELLPVTV